MANPSNLYAEKIFSEQPLALWALDEEIDYISLISEAARNMSTSWTVTGGTATTVSISDEPFTTSFVNDLNGNIPTGLYGQINAISSNIGSPQNLNNDLKTFNISSYVYADNTYVTSYEIGYEYTDSLTSITKQTLKTYNSSIAGKWIFISETFPIPNITEQIRLVLKINYINAGSPDGGYHFYVNGINYSQWSEEFAPTSLGLDNLQTLPSTLRTLGSSYVEAKSYGLINNPAYYLADSHNLFAKNSGIPMVYGASNVTRITPNTSPNKPSIIFPGQGFLNESGKHNNYTVEFWLKLENQSKDPKRIFGPVAKVNEFADGIYVDGPFIKLKIDNNIQSHFIGEWSRPMLVDLRITEGLASLLINGEEVISISIDLDKISFPEELVISQSDGLPIDQNWLGFYAYSDIPMIEIDCFAIYGYQVSALLAKRRFAFGQAVDFPESANTAYGGTSIFIDYPFADYTNNYSYPDMSSFGRGIVENCSVQNGTISAEQYSLPSVIFQDNTVNQDSWNSSNYDLSIVQSSNHSPFVSFSEYPGYIYFDKLAILKEDVKAIYGIFTATNISQDEKTLIRIDNKVDKSYFKVSIVNNQILYKIGFSGIEELLYSEGDVILNDSFFVGVDIDAIVSFFGKQVSTIFGNKSQLSVVISGNQDFSGIFDGEIHKVGFSTARNLKKMRSFFNTDFSGTAVFDAGSGYYGESGSFWNTTIDGGTPGSFIESSAYQHTASYTLVSRKYFDSFKLDIDTDSYWEDYLPLTYFAQYISNTSGGKFYDLDFIQFNINYPALPIFANGYYDTSDADIKTYVSFKYDVVKPGVFDDVYTNRISMSQNGVIQPGSEWLNTAYEVVDGAIIYPPDGVDIKKISMTTHIEITTRGIFDNPIKIKSLQYSSEAFNSVLPNPVGTRFGTKIYPYKKYGSYYDYKSRNPFRIYKGSTPYLYLTRNSGIEKVGDYDPIVNSGLAIPINENLAEEYKVIAIQAAIRFNQDKFSTTPVQIFEIESKSSYTKFFIVANDSSGKRGRIYGINSKTGKFENGISFYLNGKVVREPVVTPQTWSFLGISFPQSLDFNSYVGGLRITGQMLINTISEYKSTNLQEIQKTITRPWYRVRQSVIEDLNWIVWGRSSNWNEVLVVSSSDYFGVNPSTIFKDYTGTNKIIVDDDRAFKINNYEYNAYRYLSSQSQIITAV